MGLSQVAHSSSAAAQGGIVAPGYISTSTNTMVIPAPGLPAITKRVAESILAGNYIDFAELPPAKGRSQTCSSIGDQVVLVHATDRMRLKWLISDLSTWIQCFAMYIFSSGNDTLS